MTSANARSSGPAPLAPRILSEVEELHRRNVELARDAGGLRGRRNRRERREAREAESDLLRVLGFDTYEAFRAFANATAEDDVIPPSAPPALALVERNGSSTELDAKETEAALLRVLRGGEPGVAVPSDKGRVGAAAPSANGGGHSVDELRTRVAYFEEELAEARFELLRMRDRVGEHLADAENADPVDDAVPAAAAALVQVAAELRSLCEVLREERAHIAALGADARTEAARILDRARLDAASMRDEAATAARAVLDQASADAVALTRNAISTVDGLRRLAGDEAGRAADDS